MKKTLGLALLAAACIACSPKQENNNNQVKKDSVATTNNTNKPADLKDNSNYAISNKSLLAKANKDVWDYYQLWPREQNDPKLEDLKIDKDLKNGFLHIEGPWEGFAEFALFVDKANKKDYLALFSYGCGPGCSGSYRVMTIEGESWKDVTSEVLPDVSKERVQEALKKKKVKVDQEYIDEPPFLLMLPKAGTEVRVVLDQLADESQTRLLGLKWENGKFNLVD